MRKELRKLAWAQGKKGRQKTMLAMTILRMYRKDPKANDFLRHEAESTLRLALYHLRQADILVNLAERRDPVQPRIHSVTGERNGYFAAMQQNGLMQTPLTAAYAVRIPWPKA